MINRIFLIFDPLNKILNPFFLIIITIIKIPLKKRGKKNKNYSFSALKIISSQLKHNIKKKIKINLFNFMINKLFITILILNLWSITPFSWSITSQPAFNIQIVLTIIIIILIPSVIKIKTLLVNFTPISTPFILIPFIVIIEVISWIVRPITLILRLTANIISGHILIFLLGKICISAYIKKTIILSFAIIPLIILESIVRIIQAYILFTLIVLYIKET